MTHMRICAPAALTLLFFAGGSAVAVAAQKKACTSTSVLCADIVQHVNRVCTTTTCTYEDGHTTTTTTVTRERPKVGSGVTTNPVGSAQAPSGGNKGLTTRSGLTGSGPLATGGAGSPATTGNKALHAPTNVGTQVK
jgi:hypothetical protein